MQYMPLAGEDGDGVEMSQRSRAQTDSPELHNQYTSAPSYDEKKRRRRTKSRLASTEEAHSIKC